MEDYGKILVVAMIFFMILMIIEKIYGIYIKNDTMPLIDAISSLYSGLSNAVKDVLKLSVSLVSYNYLVNKFSIITIESTTLVYIIAFISIDFYGYWIHRWSHQINFFWNKHAIHHSSEEFNLPCALRQSVSFFVNIFVFLLLPAALLGVPSKVIATIFPIHLFMQFWYHTKHIGKMGFLEKIIVTPSHHRVHHAINPIYLDKNHGQIFIIWDKIFGTFQEELDSEPPVFGITRPANTWNPFVINYQHLYLLIHDAIRTTSWKDKIIIWFKPTGWRPLGFEEKYPVSKITDVYNFTKFKTNIHKYNYHYTIIQFILTLILCFHLFNNIALIGLVNIYVYGFFIFVMIFTATELMNNNKYTFIFSIIQLVYGISIVYFLNGWFGNLPLIYGIFILIFLITSIILSLKLLTHKKNNPAPQS
ncbi:MAG: sterol desaturase family protein [Flavobacterium sp.]